MQGYSILVFVQNKTKNTPSGENSVFPCPVLNNMQARKAVGKMYPPVNVVRSLTTSSRYTYLKQFFLGNLHVPCFFRNLSACGQLHQLLCQLVYLFVVLSGLSHQCVLLVKKPRIGVKKLKPFSNDIP